MASKSVIVKETSICLKVDRNWYVYDTDSVPLGSGAMGTVYIGRSLTQPGLRVAIKQVSPQYQDIQSIRKRALIEGNLKFAHPHLIQMIGCCEYDEIHHVGPIWIISHLVQGVSLEDHLQNLRKSKNPLKNIVETMFPILDALEYLHGGNIVHLDIKPSNIMLENGHNIRLLDLGIASVGNSGSAQVAGLVGTPQYAAPEQFMDNGDTEQPSVDATTDLYQVGITLYELLTQSNPYNAPTIHQTMVLHKTVRLPENKLIPKSILEVLRKATEPEQKQRYQNASQFRIALQQALRKEEHKPSHLWLWCLAAFFIIILILLSFVIYVRA